MLCLFALAALPLQAGLWDRDRPSAESMPGHYDVIAGRFDRFPDAYYEHRHDLALRQIHDVESSPADVDLVVERLPAFDAGAVALFRLGRHGEAIILLDRKNLLIGNIQNVRTAVAREQSRSANANKAAVLLHRWLGSDAKSTEDLQAAERLLESLLTVDAYDSDALWSLSEIQWLLSEPQWSQNADPVFPNMLGLADASFHGSLDEAALARNNVAGCLDYLARRIVYEGGWMSVDVMYAYSLALALSGHAEESLFAWYRVCELIDAGKTTRVAHAPAAKTLKRVLGVHVANLEQKSEAEKLYQEMRRKADAWVASRNSYLEVALADGRHPDTQADFWAAWQENDPGAPEAGKPVDTSEPAVPPEILIGGIGGFAVVLLLMLGGIVFLGRRSGSAPSVDEL